MFSTFFLLRAITDQFHLSYHKRYSHLSRCLMRSPCYQKRVEIFSYFYNICQNLATFNKCYFVVLRPIFSVNSGDTVFPNNLLPVILLRFKLSKYCRFFCCNNFTQYASLFSSTLSFKDLLRKLDLIMIT